MQVKIKDLTGRNLSWAVNEVRFAEMKIDGKHVKDWVLNDHKNGHVGRDLTDCAETFVELISEKKIGVEPIRGSSDGSWIAKKMSISVIGKTPIEAVLRVSIMNHYRLNDSDQTVFVPDEVNALALI
ncbi:hypothetical protein [Methylophilus sp. QUAN]|uniref:hypothetical protein n=1 Tax=Methylophilus sp. QUAN TaxID=2781020 RepID=UPI001890B22E|nr:hypothetical protein [Methylophilus sp. QUAN]MBF4991062.1 hypothetical protein [Methylophilus sp. QUAN]